MPRRKFVTFNYYCSSSPTGGPTPPRQFRKGARLQRIIDFNNVSFTRIMICLAASRIGLYTGLWRVGASTRKLGYWWVRCFATCRWVFPLQRETLLLMDVAISQVREGRGGGWSTANTDTARWPQHQSKTSILLDIYWSGKCALLLLGLGKIGKKMIFLI